MGKVIAVINQKGGVGKTTTSVNLSAALAEAGQRVLLLDFDPQANATSGIWPEGQADRPGAYEMLSGDAKAKECIIEEVFENLDLLPADIDLSGAEVELQEREDRNKILKECIRSIRKNYDYILIDCPPSLSLLTVNALTAADSTIIPVQCEYFALEGLSQVLNIIEVVRGELNRKLKIEGVLFTMFDSRTNLSQQVVDSVKGALNEHMFDTIIPRNVRLAEAPSHGLPITMYDRHSKGADSYRMLAAELLQEGGVVDGE